MNHNQECHNLQIILLLLMSYVSVEKAIRGCLERLLCINLIISLRFHTVINVCEYVHLFEKMHKVSMSQ